MCPHCKTQGGLRREKNVYYISFEQVYIFTSVWGESTFCSSALWYMTVSLQPLGPKVVCRRMPSEDLYTKMDISNTCES